MPQYMVVRLELPVQNVTKNEGGGPITVTASELHGPHRAVVLSAVNGGYIVVPMTSAQDSQGGEKWANPRGTWVRVIHDGKPAYVCCEQVRYADKHRVNDTESYLSEYDAAQVRRKIEALLLNM